MTTILGVDELEELRAESRQLALDAGLDPWDVVYGVVDYDELNEVSSYDGFPERYPHWHFGMAYDYFRKRGAYSGWWTYELVLNTRPAIAYLRSSNTRLETKGVMVHVYGHVDFFRHNRWFSKTNRDMIKTMKNHAARIEIYMDQYGITVVEEFIDSAMSLQYNIDPHAPFIKRKWQNASPKQRKQSNSASFDKSLNGTNAMENHVGKIPVKRDYMDRFVNPKSWIDLRNQQQQGELSKHEKFGVSELETQQKDILHFLINNGRLENWQQDVLSMIRDESYYFVPQIQTKVMNEGWASYWQCKIMANYADPNEFFDHAEMMSRVLGGGISNPYRLGLLIWENIKERWDKGRFGRDWELCTDAEARKNWDTGARLGEEKMFEVRRNYNDLTFIDEFFTQDLFEKHNLFAYEYIPETEAYHITSREFEEVKKKILLQYTNMGKPTIQIATGNFENKGELLLLHQWNGIGLNWEEAKLVLRSIHSMWKRPVNLKTIISRKVREPDSSRNRRQPELPLTAVTEEQGVLLRYDGESFREIALSEDEISDIRIDDIRYDTTPEEWVG
jgi:stage V sporulation protein R